MASTSDYKVTGFDDDTRLPLMVSVTAPSTLPAGYTFEAFVNGDKMRPFTCQVPEGGIREGQSFMVPLPESDGFSRINAPTGKWKDGLCDCFSLGICHPSLCCPFFCGTISMAQIMSRMSLTWLGEPGERARTKDTFKVVVMLYVAYMIFSNAMELASQSYYTIDQDTGLVNTMDVPVYISVMKMIGSVLFSFWSLYSLCKTRQSVRRQYSIPEEQCVGCEDCCCAVFCSCCTLGQMSRHTGEYENYPGVCCSSTGHNEGAPMTV